MMMTVCTYVLLSLRHGVSSSQHHHIHRELNSFPCFSGSRSVADAGTAHRCNVDDRPTMPLKVQICGYTVHIIHERKKRMREAVRAFVGLKSYLTQEWSGFIFIFE